MTELNELAAALAKAQGEMTSAKMDKQNYYGSKYATLASIQEATRPALSKHGLAIAQITVQRDNVFKLQTILMHSSGQRLISTWVIPPQADVQKSGSYLSYIKRYSWASICGIAGDDDDDGEAAAGLTQKQPAKGKPAAKAPQPAPVVNGNDSKADPWDVPQAKGVRVFCDAVRAKTNYYNAPKHLFNAVDGWPIAGNEADFAAKLNAAVDHASQEQ